MRVLFILFCVFFYANTQAQTGQEFPMLIGQTVNGDVIDLPEAVQEKYTLVGIAYSKKSQEQFEYSVHRKKLKIHVSQITKFLAIWKLVKTSLFSDVKIKTQFWLQNKSFNSMLLFKINYDKFKSPKIFKSEDKLSKNLNLSSGPISSTFLTLLDIRGEILLKHFLRV